MANKNNNIIYWVAGIVLFVIVATQLPSFHFPFAIVQQTVCAEGVTNYYSLDGNLLDSKGNLDLINHGAIFINGKINQGIELNGTTYVSFPSIPSNVSVAMWLKNYSNVGSDWYYGNGLPLSTQFGLGFNGSVDEVIVGTNISGLSNIQPCYIQTTYENVTCSEYLETTVQDQSSGCISYNGTFFPNCSYVRENTTTYKIENNLCKKNFYCQLSCLSSGGCYPTNQNCIESLVYDCYVLSNNACSEKTDYTSCIANTANTYSTLSGCNTNVQVSTSGAITETTTTEQTSESPLTKEIFNLFGISITALHLLIVLIIIVGTLYLLSRKK
jgi:hypothetical protein